MKMYETHKYMLLLYLWTGTTSTLIVVPYGASKTISVGNVLTANTLVKNANIIIEKVS